MNELFKKNIVGLHKMLVEKEISAIELAGAFLNRIADKDKSVRAFVSVTEEEAKKSALAVDQKIAKGQFIGLLEGIPASVKDVLATAGTKTTASSNMLANYVPPYDATSVEKLGREGLVMLGKTNCDAFAHGASTENSDFFQTHNPWDLDRIPGGSSGGAAASVAGSMSVYALGTDTGGSIRSPANYCGIVGIKPSYGRVSRHGLFAMTSSNDTVGVMAKNVEDCALVLGAMAGEDAKDATTRRTKVPNYHEEIKKFNFKDKKIGIPKEYFGEGMHGGVRSAVEGAIAKMESLGAKIVPISLPHTQYAVAIYYIVTPSEVSSNLARYDGIKYGYSVMSDLSRKDQIKDLLDVYTQSRKYGFGAEAKRRIMIGTYALSSGYHDAYYKKATAARHLLADDFKTAFKSVDFIATPVAPTLPCRLGEKVSDPLALYLEDIYLAAVSLSGLPALSVPCGFARDGQGDTIDLPVGLQLIGNYFDESTILGAAYHYEQSEEWRLRYPNI
ncbi:MAG: aspartyl-tRNA(Asn)/glutamyl-tRNA (Gln) amidotransferase subunit A [Parcubacteria group bacterium Gr01-1014_18]|nr:MAG: aspartyl-tRNA(Asn)/glutamyl-tRNA (Gln) amidotransferase subunit A [Parcubacteria group bacterium Greene0416_36]TSC80844.1 MAG: aspartyl-tRNA(Asn)/glutamyl-tRNA (Gln) amidotransferase subunit A [Parcubacteria group bacterium Gr01-1014_18]TSC99505.1 MAG: aspartyl-tRNA(Asn)/glutamyl-tRNA (Gln) amidotransferase subunit A [Parcubacteria group bacterium Greene1014_20]TSD07575.1 MAG: aspartyl-tRNA(Asn)/glutamyl-tRNA (Gln) amidotransferase subunit A [Parcubacteria group bacterium Greene0714_2]